MNNAPNPVLIYRTIIIIIGLICFLFVSNSPQINCSTVALWETTDMKWWIKVAAPFIAVLLAAIIAQTILHQFAIKRERRERKLKAIEGLLIDIAKLNKQWATIKTSKAKKDLTHILVEMSIHTIKIRSIGDVYSLNTTNSLNNFQSLFDHIWDYFTDEEDGKNFKRANPDTYWLDIIHKDKINLLDSFIKQMIDTLKDAHEKA